MNKQSIFPILILFTFACSAERSHVYDPIEKVSPDSILVVGSEADTSLYETPEIERPTESLPSEMIGSWEAVELRIGDMIMTARDLQEQGISPPVRYFSAQRYMQFGRPSGELPRIPFTYFQGIIHSLDQGKEQVLYLGLDTLILSADIDGELSTYTFHKMQ
ncbi:MAG: hypothetical protein AAF694_00285 [Bacteroidota bacterium]